MMMRIGDSKNEMRGLGEEMLGDEGMRCSLSFVFFSGIGIHVTIPPILRSFLHCFACFSILFGQASSSRRMGSGDGYNAVTI